MCVFLSVPGMGCFWGAERRFWLKSGVFSTQVGYAGGVTPNPNYEEVCSGTLHHCLLRMSQHSKTKHSTFGQAHNVLQTKPVCLCHFTLNARPTLATPLTQFHNANPTLRRSKTETLARARWMKSESRVELFALKSVRQEESEKERGKKERKHSKTLWSSQQPPLHLQSVSQHAPLSGCSPPPLLPVTYL